MGDGKEELSFQQHLLKLIIEKDLDNTTVYKSSNVTKGAFSKILCGDTKKPQKKTVLGLCIGLRLTLEEAEELLASADMAFNPYNKRDKLVILSILVDTFISKISFPMQPGPEIGSISDA